MLAPVLGPSQKKMAMSPSSNVLGQHDTKYVTFVADEIWGFMPEPARNRLLFNALVPGSRGIYA